MADNANNITGMITDVLLRLSGCNAEHKFIGTISQGIFQYLVDKNLETEELKKQLDSKNTEIDILKLELESKDWVIEQLKLYITENGLKPPDIYCAAPQKMQYSKTTTHLPLPKRLDTEDAQRYFKIAINKNYLKITGNTFKWVGTGDNGRKAQLAYFCGRIYGYENSMAGNKGANFPEDSLCELFRETRLYSSLKQVYDAKKTQAWKIKIDAIFS